MTFDALHLAFELLEYKFDDLRHQRPVRGGAESVWALLREVEASQHRLAPDQQERLEAMQRELARRPVSGGASPGMPAAPSLEGLTLTFGAQADASSPATGTSSVASGGAAQQPSVSVESPSVVSEAVMQERAHLRRLSRRVFDGEVNRFARAMAASWRAERERLTARLMYATLRNLERYAAMEAFGEDANLRTFRVVEPLPEVVDPLVTLAEAEGLSDVARESVQAVMGLCDRSPAPPVERHASLDYLRRLAHAVARDPYAGKLSAREPAGPSARDLRLELRDVARQNLPDWQKDARRAEVQERLREREAWERSQQKLLRDDQPRFLARIDAFFDQLAEILPASVGGQARAVDRLDGGVLFALEESVRLEAPAADATALTMRIDDSLRVPFAGDTWGVSVHDGHREAHWAGETIPLDVDRETEVAGARLLTFVEGAYLHVRLHRKGGSLATRIAELAGVLHVRRVQEASMLVAALARFANHHAGKATGVIVGALRRVQDGVRDADAPLTAARDLLAGAFDAAGVHVEASWLDDLARYAVWSSTPAGEDLERALDALRALDERAEGPVVVPFTGEPVDVTVDGRTFTVRRYDVRGEGHLVVMLPGQVVASFREHVVTRLGGGTLVGVQGDGKVVLAYLPSVNIGISNPENGG